MRKTHIILSQPGYLSKVFENMLCEIMSSRKIDLRELLPQEMRSESILGKEFKHYITQGEIIHPDLLNKLIKREINKDSTNVIIVNYPKTEEQYNSLKKLIDIDRVWNLKIVGLDFFIEKQYSKLNEKYILENNITRKALKLKVSAEEYKIQTLIAVIQKDYPCTLVEMDYENELKMTNYFNSKIEGLK